MEFRLKEWNWRGSAQYSLTPMQVLEQVRSDSLSDYNWKFSASELVRICRSPAFPEETAKEIMLAVLNSAANIYFSPVSSFAEEGYDDAVNFCFNFLKRTNEEVRIAKNKFLKGIIFSARQPARSFSYFGDTFRNFCKDWEAAKFEEYCDHESLNFKEFKREIRADFNQKLKSAEEQGLLVQDKSKWDFTRSVVLSMMKKHNT